MFRKKRPTPPGDDENPLASRVGAGDDRPTVPLDADPEAPTRRLDPETDAPTRLLGPAGDGPMADPPVGVLLILSGPGQGRLLAVGYGMNALGRDPGSRIRLDFGDERISRAAHARLSYDPESGRFFLQHGGGANLTYLNGAPVLEPAPLRSGDRLRLGDTELLFRPLVGEDFDWRAEGDAHAPG